MDELFNTRAGDKSLPVAEETELIAKAQAGDGDSSWALLVQYRGLLQKVANSVRKSVRGMTPEQVEDLYSDLVLAAVQTIQSFDQTRFIRLSQVMPGRLKDVAMEMTTSLTVPRGTLALWFKVWRAGEQDFDIAANLAPKMGMTSGTFRAISNALVSAGSEWVTVPYTAGVPTPDAETYHLAQAALAVLTDAEHEVIELVYGFRGDPKSDAEVGLIRDTSPRTIKEQRQRAVAKMRTALA